MLLTFILSFSPRIQTVNAIRFACSQARMLRPVNSACRVLLTTILSLLRRIGTVSAIRVCYTLRVASLRSALWMCYRITPSHDLSPHLIARSPNHAHRKAARHRRNRQTTRTPIHTEKVNPFFTILNQLGDPVESNSFPFGRYGFKMYVEPVTSEYVIKIFHNIFFYQKE